METKEKCAGTCCPPLSQPANQDNGHCNLKTFEKTCDSKIPSSCCDKGSNKSTCFSSEEKSCDKSDRKEPNGSSCCAKRACNTDKAEEKRCSLGGRVVANPISAKEKSCSDNTRSETCSAKRCKTKTKKSYCGGGDLLNSENESSKSCCCSGSHDDHHLIMSDCASTTEKCCGADDCCCDSPSQYQAKTSCCTGCGEKGCCVGVVGSNVNPNRSTKRSTFYVEEICCATEISAIRSIVGPLDGVASVRVNATSKILYVDHDVGKISALNICDALNHERFGARIEKDAALETYAASSFVTSILAFVDQQTPVKDALVDFLANQDSTILQSFVVDVRGKRITLVHNALLMPASHIAQALLAALGVQAQVLKDGEESLVWEFDNIIEQENEEENAPASSHSMLRPTVALSGVLWVISMLSFIGGNW